MHAQQSVKQNHVTKTNTALHLPFSGLEATGWRVIAAQDTPDRSRILLYVEDRLHTAATSFLGRLLLCDFYGHMSPTLDFVFKETPELGLTIEMVNTTLAVDVGQIWLHRPSKKTVVVGNVKTESGKLRYAHLDTGAKVYILVPVLDIHEQTHLHCFADTVHLCLQWAKGGFSDAMWWLGWCYEELALGASTWFYLAAMRRRPRLLGWALDRVWCDTHNALVGERYGSLAVEPAQGFLESIPDLSYTFQADLSPGGSWEDALQAALTCKMHVCFYRSQFRLGQESKS